MVSESQANLASTLTLTLTRATKLRLGFMTGTITLIAGLLFWIFALRTPLNLTYVTNLSGNLPLEELRFLQNVPLIQIFLILFGVITLILVRFEKASAFPFCLISLSLLFTFLTGNFFGVGYGGFPMPWEWTTIGRCASCVGEPFFVMIYAFFLDWTIWSLVTLGALYAIRSRFVNHIDPGPTQ